MPPSRAAEDAPLKGANKQDELPLRADADVPPLQAANKQDDPPVRAADEYPNLRLLINKVNPL